MISRRDYLKLCVATGVALGMKSVPSLAANADRKLELITRAIPASGERLPAVGLGSSATFAEVARSEDVAAVREVLQALIEHGGRVFDTAPSYGASEAVAGRVAGELGITDKVFWATKLNVAGWGGGRADAAAAWASRCST
jgi:aryl-alcohol dehydrogenase-like predicted oxidoreductase